MRTRILPSDYEFLPVLPPVLLPVLSWRIQTLRSKVHNPPTAPKPRSEAGPLPLVRPCTAGGEVGLGHLDHQVKMVAHQAIGMDMSAGLLACLSQPFDEIMAVHIAQENNPRACPRDS